MGSAYCTCTYRVVYTLGLWAQPPHTEGRNERVRDICKKPFLNTLCVCVYVVFPSSGCVFSAESGLHSPTGALVDQRVQSPSGVRPHPVYDPAGPLSHQQVGSHTGHTPHTNPYTPIGIYTFSSVDRL